MGRYNDLDVSEDILNIFIEAQHYSDATNNDNYFNRRLMESHSQRQYGDVNFKEWYAE